MSGVYDPMLLVDHVMKYLAKQGCQPQLRGSRTTAAQAARELLLSLDVEPGPVNVEMTRHGVYGNSLAW